MRILPCLSALALLPLATSCVAPPRVPAPPPAAARIVVPPPPAAPAVMPTDWRDWPQTAGDWRYVAGGSYSTAVFGVGQELAAALTCDRARRVVTLAVPASVAAPITIRTSSATRAVPTVVRAASGVLPPATAQAELSAGDPLLDAIGFSRGRFTLERPGAPPLVLPAWPELERVVEDCRG